MKNSLQKTLTFLFAFLAANIHAQIPNSGFENWTTVGSYEEPLGWWTANSTCTGPFYEATKSTDHYPASNGSYSIRLENNIALFPSYCAYGFTWSSHFS